MPRINTYPPDAILQNEDLILGSDYKGTVNGVPIYETKSFSLNSLANYLSRYVYVNPNIYDLELIYTNLENIDAANVRIDETITTITTVQTNLQNQIATDLADLQSQTEQSITLLDTTLNSAISDVADTITTEVSNLNDRILQGETDLAADILALGDTITTETQNLTTLINTETGLIADTVANLDNSITLQLGELNTDIAGALQQAIDAGELAVEAQASVDAEVIARTSAVGAVAGKVETIETQFTFSTEDGSIVGTSGALNETINTTASTAAGAVATRVDILETEYVLSTEDGSILGLSENSVTNVALTTVTGAVATRVDTIETQFTITDGVVTGFSQAARDRIDTSISNATSAQFQTLDAIKTQFVFTDGNVTAVSDVIQTSITDSISNATSAQFTKLDEVATQFVFDGDSITGVQGAVSSTIDSAKLEAISTAELAAQSKVDTFAAKIVTTDENGDITGLSDAIQTTVSDVIAQDGYAESSRVDTLEATVGDANSGLVASVSTNQSAVADINGNLTASYGVHVKAGNKIAGLKLLADGSTDSNFIAQADIFGVEMPNGTRVLTVDENGLLIDGSGTFTGDFNAGLIEIRSNTIKLKAEPNYGSTGDIEFYNQAGVLFGAIRSRSVNINGTDHDAITIGSPFAGALDTVLIDGQAIIANPADYDAFETGQGGVQFGNFVSPWETVGVSASQSISLRTGDPGVLVDPPNSIFMYNGGPGVIWTSIDSEGYVSINSAGAIYLNPGANSGVYINGVEIGTSTSTSSSSFSGSYNDLTDKPTLFSGSYTDLTNKPTLFSGSYADLTNKPSTFPPSSHNHDDRYYTESESNSRFTSRDHFRSTGTGYYTSTTTADLIAEALADGAFNSYLTAHKTGWSYAGNGDLTDAGRLTELAGSSWLWWTDNSADATQGNITGLCIAPNTGGSAGKVFIYNNQGSSYDPGWREVWTSRSDGSGSGLDADKLDGLQASQFLRKDQSQIMSSGSTLTAADFIVASDQRIKHDISTYDPGTVNINFRTYRLNSSPDRLRYGVIAQELERDHPEMVITNPDTGMKAVSYVDMLVAKVAELEKRIKQLENGGS